MIPDPFALLEIRMGKVFIERVNPEAPNEPLGQRSSPKKTEKLFTVKQAAAYLNLARNTLDKHRLNGTGPEFRKVGTRSIRYTQEALDDWLGKNG